MNERELARAVAADLGGDVAAETERELRGEPPPPGDRSLDAQTAMTIASFLISCSQLALQVWQARRDRALLLEALEAQAPQVSLKDREERIERRLGIIGRIVDLVIPESIDSSPSLGPQSARTKQEWLKEWPVGALILQPFADMDYYIVREPFSWRRSADGPSEVPNVVTVPKGFVTDLATIPRFFWWALPPQGRYGHAAILHDWLYWNQQTSREIADLVFKEIMKEMVVGTSVRQAMWAAVRVYGGSYWVQASKDKYMKQYRVLAKFPESAAITWNEWRKRPDVFDPEE